MLPHSAEIIKDDANGHYLRIQILYDYYMKHPPQPRCIKAFPGLRIITDSNGNSSYETRKYQGRFEIVQHNLMSHIKRYLNSDRYKYGGVGGSWVSFTPINGRFHVLNEELCIMLAYFHLSNVVRYNPEHLYKIMDSKYWAILLGLRKHGF